jgi:amino acid adenylation domain-containing protein
MSKAEDVLQAKLQKLSPAQREALLKKLQQQKAKSAKLSESLRDKPIAKIARSEQGHALSYSQQRMWFLEQFNEGHNAYNIAASFELKGELHSELLNQSLKHIITRHESLRTVFSQDAQGPRQKVLEQIDFELHCIDMQGENEQALQQQITTLCNQQFDLSAGPLFSITLFKTGTNCHVLNIVMHHIISDAWSANIMMAEVSAIYSKLAQGASVAMPGPNIQYIDYSAWQQDYLAEIAESQKAFWQEELAQFSNLNLATDKPRPAVNNGNGSFYRVQLDKNQSTAFAKLCQSEGCSSFHGYLAAYQVLLNRYSEQDDFCIGIPVAGRQHADTENLIGFFVNSLAIRADIDTELNFKQLLQKVKSRSLNALSHQDLPFEKLVEIVSHERSANINPIFQTFFSYDQGNTDAELKLPNIESRYLPADISGSKFDISLTLKDNPEGLSCHFEYNADLYHEQSIARIAKHFLRLITLINSQSEQAVGKLRLLDEQEQAEQLDLQTGFNATAANYPKSTALQHLIEAQVEKTPDAIAVSDSREQLSYQQLNLEANQLAHYLQSLQTENSKPIAVCLDRSCNMSRALLAVLKSGTAYTPILSDLPKNRINYILQDIQAELVVCDNSSHALFTANDDNKNIKAINLDDAVLLNSLNEQESSNLTGSFDGEQLFNIIYTSGSTGEPKGVMVPHRGIINRLQWMQQAYPIGENDRILQKTPFNFDVSVWELFWPLMQGAEIVFAKPDGHKDPSYIQQIIAEKNISTCHFVPSMLEVFLGHYKNQMENDSANTMLNSLKQVFTSGEALSINQVALFKALLPQSQLHNLYGPTEASIDVSYFDCSQTIESASVPIGKPIANTELYILDQQQRLLPKGAIGELYIGGANIAKGYWNKPELTAASFIANPFQVSNQGSATLYKTGDLARFLNDGNIEYLGRIDHQVKIRGLRIELGEIENCLIKHPAIEQAVVSTQTINGQNALVAYYTASPESQGQDIESSALRQHLAADLPDYMLPTAFMRLEEIPLSSNGKACRKSLPSISLGDIKQQEFIAPRTTIEQELAIIWQDLLGIDTVGVLDNFFELGGHSLLATQMLLRIKDSFAIELPLRSLFEVSTVEGIAKLIEALQPVAATNSHSEIDSSNSLNNADDDEGFEEGIL